MILSVRRRTLAAQALLVIGTFSVAGALGQTLDASAATPGSAADAAPRAAAGSPTEWSVAPASGDGADGRVSMRHTLEPGTELTDAIVVTNLGAAGADFQVRAGDGVVGDTGAFDISSGAPVDSGSWVRVDGLVDGRLALAAGEARVLPVTVAVPGDARPGDHPAGIVVGVSSGDGTTTVTNRIGVRLHLRVAGEVAPQLAVSDISTTYTPSWIPFAPGRLDVAYTLRNSGNVRLGAAAGVRASGPLGLSAIEQTEAAGELLPGDAVEQRVSISAPPLVVLAGEVDITPVSVGEDEVLPPAAVSETFRLVAVSWTGLGVVALVAGVLFLLLRRRRGPLSPVDRRGRPRVDDPSALQAEDGVGSREGSGVVGGLDDDRSRVGVHPQS